MKATIILDALVVELPENVKYDAVQETHRGPFLQCTIINPASKAHGATLYVDVQRALAIAIREAAAARCIEFGDPSED